jgi:hypothetical protein
MTDAATREAWKLGLVAAAKKKQAEKHGFRLTLDSGAPLA